MPAKSALRGADDSKVAPRVAAMALGALSNPFQMGIAPCQARNSAITLRRASVQARKRGSHCRSGWPGHPRIRAGAQAGLLAPGKARLLPPGLPVQRIFVSLAALAHADRPCVPVGNPYTLCVLVWSPILKSMNNQLAMT